LGTLGRGDFGIHAHCSPKAVAQKTLITTFDRRERRLTRHHLLVQTGHRLRHKITSNGALFGDFAESPCHYRGCGTEAFRTNKSALIELHDIDGERTYPFSPQLILRENPPKLRPGAPCGSPTSHPGITSRRERTIRPQTVSSTGEIGWKLAESGNARLLAATHSPALVACAAT